MTPETKGIRILLIGSGGREHALAWKLSQAQSAEHIFVFPGNGATSQTDKVSNVATEVEIADGDYSCLVSLAKELNIGLVVVGPDSVVVDGIEAYFRESKYLLHNSILIVVMLIVNKVEFPVSALRRNQLNSRVPRRLPKSSCSSMAFRRLPMMLLLSQDTDLTAILLACTNGSLDKIEIQIRPGYACNVVVSASGYPEPYQTGKTIHISPTDPSDVQICHAGTKRLGDVLQSAGGRVLSVAAYGESLEEAVQRAYDGVDKVSFEGMYFRKDIAAR